MLEINNKQKKKQKKFVPFYISNTNKASNMKINYSLFNQKYRIPIPYILTNKTMLQFDAIFMYFTFFKNHKNVAVNILVISNLIFKSFKS